MIKALFVHEIGLYFMKDLICLINGQIKHDAKGHVHNIVVKVLCELKMLCLEHNEMKLVCIKEKKKITEL